MSEVAERCSVGWYGVICEVSTRDRLLPTSLVFYRLVHALAELLLYRIESYLRLYRQRLSHHIPCRCPGARFKFTLPLPTFDDVGPEAPFRGVAMILSLRKQ